MSIGELRSAIAEGHVVAPDRWPAKEKGAWDVLPAPFALVLTLSVLNVPYACAGCAASAGGLAKNKSASEATAAADAK